MKDCSTILSPERDTTVKHPVLHARLRDYQTWLEGLLSFFNGPLGDDERSVIAGEIHDYAQGASSDPAVKPLVDLLEGLLLEALDNHLHSKNRRVYQAYLQTEGWERTREKVLKRAGYICEGCRERPATQVHHLNYKDPRGEELLWNLVAVCDQCHKVATARQKEHHELDAT